MIIDEYSTEHTPGTEDWIEVAAYDSGGGYEWAIWKCWWSPSARRYFYDGDSGCSCNAWEPPKVGSAFTYCETKPQLVEALKSFADDYYEPKALRLIDEIHRFTKPKGDKL